MTEYSVAREINKCYVIRLGSGMYGYVGKIPTKLYYVDGATDEQIELAQKFGARFGPERRTFGTEQEAIDLAEEHGVVLGKIIK